MPDLPDALKSCPFCNATPHRGPAKIQYDQMRGEPFQRYRIWCPHGCACIDRMNEEQAIAAWNARTLQEHDAQLTPLGSEFEKIWDDNTMSLYEAEDAAFSTKPQHEHDAQGEPVSLEWIEQYIFKSCMSYKASGKVRPSLEQIRYMARAAMVAIATKTQQQPQDWLTEARDIIQNYVNGVETGMITSVADEALVNVTRRARAALEKLREDGHG